MTASESGDCPSHSRSVLAPCFSSRWTAISAIYIININIVISNCIIIQTCHKHQAVACVHRILHKLWSGERCKLPQRGRAEPQKPNFFSHVLSYCRDLIPSLVAITFKKRFYNRNKRLYFQCLGGHVPQVPPFRYAYAYGTKLQNTHTQIYSLSFSLVLCASLLG